MTVRKIHYDIKVTASNTQYVLMNIQDQNWITMKLIEMQSYMNELSISSNKDAKEITKFWYTPTRTLPFNTYLKKHNSYASFCAGLLNNQLFGNQRDFTVIQIEHLGNCINYFTQLRLLIEQDLKIQLQKNPDTNTVAFVQQLFD